MTTIPTVFVLFVFSLALSLLLVLPLAVGAAGKEVGFPQLEQYFELGSIFAPQ